MSLLMDALKRAEQANKRGQASGQPKPASPLTLEPTQKGTTAIPSPHEADDVPESISSGLPVLEALDDEFWAHAKESALRRSRASDATTNPPRQRSGSNATGDAAQADAGRDTVRKVFTAKQTMAPANSFLITLLVLSAIAAAGLGIYFWLQLGPITGLAAKSASATAVAPPAQTFPVASTAATTVSGPAAPAVRTLPPHSTGAASIAPRPAAPERNPSDTIQRPGDAGMAPIRISKSRTSQEPLATSAYAAFQAGDLPSARTAYEHLLSQDPRSIEALEGLAAVDLREGKLDEAQTSYLRILEIDPRNATAHANLIDVKGDADPIALESRLKSLLASQPDLPVLSFSLGNIYASQGRWSEAQAAYFKAFSMESDNPDYAFNLAVSLDQLHQTRLAKQYYEHALNASEGRPAGFDRTQALSRLQALQR